MRTKDHIFDSVSHLIQYHMENNLPIISSGSEVSLKQPVRKENNMGHMQYHIWSPWISQISRQFVSENCIDYYKTLYYEANSKSIDCTFCCCSRRYSFVYVCMNICICVYLCRSIETNKHSYVDIYNLSKITPSECEIHLWEGFLDMHKCHFQGHTESVTF